MTTFYRATLILERVEPDEHDDLGERRTEIGAHTVTGDTAADAMVQMCSHADSLYGWHQQRADEAEGGDVEPLPLLDEAFRPGPPVSGLGEALKAFFAPSSRHLCVICGAPGPLKREGDTWVCPECAVVVASRDDPADIVERIRQAVAGAPFVDPSARHCSRCLQPFEPGHACADGAGPACGDVYRTGGGSSYACSLKPGHEGPHLDGPQGDVAWRNTGWRGADGDEPGQEGAEAEDDPAFVDTEADRDREMAQHLAADPFPHCHKPVGGGYCHRTNNHGGDCSTSSKADDTRAKGGLLPDGVIYSTGGDNGPEALAKAPAPTNWCGDPDHDDPCDRCEAVLVDASDALRQRMPGAQQ